jgi:hypothetical protein
VDLRVRDALLPAARGRDRAGRARDASEDVVEMTELTIRDGEIEHWTIGGADTR